MPKSSRVGIAVLMATFALACGVPDESPYGLGDESTALFSAGGGSAILVAIDPAGLTPTSQETTAVQTAVGAWQSVFDGNDGVPLIEYTTDHSTANVKINFETSGNQYWCGSADINVWEWIAGSCGDYQRPDPHDLTQALVHEICETQSELAHRKSVTSDVIASMCPCDDKEPLGSIYLPAGPCPWEKQQVLAGYGVRGQYNTVDWESFFIEAVEITSETEGYPGDIIQLTAVTYRRVYSIEQGSEGPVATDQADVHPVQWTPQPEGFDPLTETVVLGSSGTVRVIARAEPADDVVYPWPEDTVDITILDPSVHSVEVDPPSLVLTDHSSQTLYRTLTAQAYTAGGDPIDGVHYTWSNSNPSVVRLVGTFGQNVSVEGIRSGFATITVQADGESDQALVRVRCGTKSNPECQQF